MTDSAQQQHESVKATTEVPGSVTPVPTAAHNQSSPSTAENSNTPSPACRSGMNPMEYRAGEHPTDRLDVSLSRAEIALLLRHALPPLLAVDRDYALRDVADRAKQSLEGALRERPTRCPTCGNWMEPVEAVVSDGTTYHLTPLRCADCRSRAEEGLTND